MIDVPEAVLRARLTRAGRAMACRPPEIAEKLDGNDIPNGRMVRADSAPADVVLRQDA
jgi:hypothetical protein